MKKKYCIIILFFIILSSCSMHKKVPNLSITTTQAFKINNLSLFLINYYIYYAPKGIARFPDGGTSKPGINKYYLFQYDHKNNKLKNLGEIIFKEGIKIILFKYIKIVPVNTHVYMLIDYYEDQKKKEGIFQYNIKTKTIKSLNRKKYNINFKYKNVLSISSTGKLFENMLFFKQYALPDPCSFIKKSIDDKNIKKIILNREGNRSLRMALIGKLIIEKKQYIIEDILKQFPKYMNPNNRYFQQEEKNLIKNIINKY